MSKNFYISDTHLGHANIIGFDGRRFKDTAEMEKVIVENWNSRVDKGDSVYILGDFCWSTEPEWLRILSLLNGNKILIRGNHDIKHMSATLKKCFAYIKDYDEISDNGKKIIMSHYPILFYRSSYNENVWHFCGHTHNRTNEDFKRRKFIKELVESRENSYDNRGQIVNVGAMMSYVDFTPRTADELIAWWRSEYIK